MLKISQLDQTLKEDIINQISSKAYAKKSEFRAAITKLVENALEEHIIEEMQNTQAYQDYAKLEKEQWSNLTLDQKQGREESGLRDELEDKLTALEADFEAYREQLTKSLEPLKIEIIEELMQ